MNSAAPDARPNAPARTRPRSANRRAECPRRADGSAVEVPDGVLVIARRDDPSSLRTRRAGRRAARPRRADGSAVGVSDGLLAIGYGNPLRGDDAVGLHVARRARESGFEAIETVQLVPELAGRIAAARLVLFVDCDVSLAPGEVAAAELPPPDRHALHDPASPAMLVGLAELLYGRAPRARAIGIGPQSLDLGEELTPVVRDAVDAAVRLCGVESVGLAE